MEDLSILEQGVKLGFFFTGPGTVGLDNLFEISLVLVNFSLALGRPANIPSTFPGTGS